MLVSKERQNIACNPMASSALFHSSCVLFPQLLCWGSLDVPAVLAEVTRAQEVAAAAEAACVTAMLVVDTSTREAAVVQDNTTLCVKGVKDRAALAEREALERVLWAEVENAMALASCCEDAEGFAHKITHIEDKHGAERQAQEVSEREHREKFGELTLL
jgi:hypothetical protein